MLFFFKQKTAYEMRISDWSSDVCSSDLTMSLSTITLEDALQLLKLPRVVGQHPDGGEIVASNGKFGPYIKWGDETRSVDTEEKLLSIAVDEAVKVLAEPKKFGRRKAAPAPPLNELGNDTVSEKPAVGKDGRFGPSAPERAKESR